VIIPGRTNSIPIISAVLLFLSFSASSAQATQQYAVETGLDCKQCHVHALGGEPLTEEGTRFLAGLKASGRYRSLSTTQHMVRLTIGYFHMLAAIIWFGAILYVHVLLKPAYASKGLPRGELRLGFLSMIVVAITGVLLTIARIPSWSAFYTTRFGILLGIKICLYLVMLTSALIVAFFIGPRLKRGLQAAAEIPASGLFTKELLSRFNGKEGRPAFLAYKGIVYDVTKSRYWKNGQHMMKHAAGTDLSEFLGSAPHGEDKVLLMQRVGTLAADNQPLKRPFHERLFYFFAYMNLALVFVVTFIIALWRWW